MRKESKCSLWWKIGEVWRKPSLGVSFYLARAFDEYRCIYLTCPGSLNVLIQLDLRILWITC